MKIPALCFFLISSTVLYAQSKKELQAEISRLHNEIGSLKATIEEMKKPPVFTLANEHQKASYGLGVLLASNIKQQGSDSLDIEILNAAIKDVMQNSAQQMDAQEAMAIVQPYMEKAQERKNNLLKAEGQMFLEKNKTQEGVIVTASGLQYKILNEGAGKKASAESNVTVHYTGKLIDGTVFDSSVERGEPATFGVGQVIEGWTESLQLMREGDKWMLFVPSDLAYGERGAGNVIPPHAVLIFEVELIKVE